MQAIPLNPRQEKERKTYSVCPVCLKRLPAILRKQGEEWRMFKECPDHGLFNTVIWRGAPERPAWTGPAREFGEEDVAHCPDSCGICSAHKQGTCCVLLEITSRCDLSCPFCFAEAGEQRKEQDPPLETLQKWIAEIAQGGKSFLQLSGGEPTMREDLPQIIRYAREQGCRYVQLNSNGLRLAEDEAFVEKLAQAGLSFVFLQFDGTDDAVYTALRGRPLLQQKLKAIENCGKHNIGVTLVPTVVPGVNDNSLGHIIRLAVENSPVVRGVHFQPVSYFGRHPENGSTVPDEQRITLPEVFRAVFEQAGDIVPANSIVQSRCDHPACGFHGGYIVTPDGLRALSSQEQAPCCGDGDAAERNRHFVGSRWERPKTPCCGSESNDSSSGLVDLTTLDGFLQRAKSHAFTISAMAFQDACTLDLERLQYCSLHVYDKGRVRPFCAKYIFG